MARTVNHVGDVWEENVDGPFSSRVLTNVGSINRLLHEEALAKNEALNAIVASLQVKGKISAAKLKTIVPLIVPIIQDLAGTSWSRGVEANRAADTFARGKKRGTQERDEAIFAEYLGHLDRGKGSQKAIDLIANKPLAERYVVVYGKKRKLLSAAAIRGVIKRMKGSRTT